MAVLLSYDLSDKHQEFKDEMELLGYTKIVHNTSPRINLPNTTLSHPTKTTKQAVSDAQTTATKLNVILQRCFAVEYTVATGIQGESYDI